MEKKKYYFPRCSLCIGVSTIGAGGASAPPRRITSNLGGKKFLIGMPYKAKKEDSNSVLLMCMNTNVVLIV